MPRSRPDPRKLAPMEARLVDALPSGAGWQFEPKWDGFRCLAAREGSRVEMSAKSGKTLARYFPEMVEQIAALPVRNDSFVLDGELAIPVGPTLDFEALQLRLHPAESRIRKLAHETPAIFILFDLLIAPGGKSLIGRPLTERRAALESFLRSSAPHYALRLSPYTRQRSTAQAWLEPRGRRARRRRREASRRAVHHGRARLAQDQAPAHRRLRRRRLSLRNRQFAGRLASARALRRRRIAPSCRLHLGYRQRLPAQSSTRKLEAVRGAPGFTGNTPGGPSRWSTERSEQWEPLKPKLVAEVRYDHVTRQPLPPWHAIPALAA